jgi:hypothetical protein
MKKHIVITGLIVILVGAAPWLFAQTEDLSANRSWGVGARFLPSALSPVAPYLADPALGTAIGVQYWLNDLLGIEAGGWMSQFKDTWNETSTTLLSGGLLLKLANGVQADFYLVGRAISLSSVSKSRIFFEPLPTPVEPRPEPKPEPKSANVIPPCPPWYRDGIARPCPWPGYESRSSTLAFEAAGGIAWSVSPQVGLALEFGFIYAQAVTTNIPGPPPPWPPDGPKPLQQPETSASSSLGLTLHVSAYFYF